MNGVVKFGSGLAPNNRASGRTRDAARYRTYDRTGWPTHCASRYRTSSNHGFTTYGRSQQPATNDVSM